MWERPGDDSKLSSYRIDASRYFSLLVTAKKLQEDSDIGGYDPYSMQSLLVIATALEDGPLTSLLDKGKQIQAKDLQARCARLHAQVACPGFGEIHA
ncbi:unnamed protein product [Fusarium langsethiae]|nr:unnamed protein product [Fusarium langsethiae]